MKKYVTLFAAALALVLSLSARADDAAIEVKARADAEACVTSRDYSGNSGSAGDLYRKKRARSLPAFGYDCRATFCFDDAQGDTLDHFRLG